MRTNKNNEVEETASRASTDRIQTVTASDFDERVLHAQGPVAVEFMSYGCGHCRVIEPVLQKVAKEVYSTTVAEIFGLQISGLPAWLVWAFIHLAFLVTFQSRILVFIQWAIQDLTFNRGSRLITGVVPTDFNPNKELSTFSRHAAATTGASSNAALIRASIADGGIR